MRATSAAFANIGYGGQVINRAVLVALGITETGHRRVIGVSVSVSEAEVHWRDFMQRLTQRGRSDVKYIVCDDHAGLNAARTIRVIFNAPNHDGATRLLHSAVTSWRTDNLKLAAWAKSDLPEGFAVFSEPVVPNVVLVVA